jgi:hypothetical protein
VCVECASEEPSHLERGVPTESEVVAAAINPEIEAVQASTKGINDGLNCFLVKPPGLKGKELFAHMVAVRLINTKATSPSEYLDVVVSTSNRTVLKDAAEASMSKRNIMKDAGGANATMKLAARKLDQMGYIKLHSGIVNTPKMLAKMTNQMQMSKLLAEIRTIETTATVDKKKIYTDSLILLAPSAKIKLASNSGDVMKLTKKEMCSLLLESYNTLIEDSKFNKPRLASMLSEKIVAGRVAVARTAAGAV